MRKEIFFMIDGITAVVEGIDWEVLHRNPLLNWGRRIREDDGTPLSGHCSANYCGLHFELFDSARLKIRGSIHRFFNKGRPNTTVFTFSNLSHAITELCNLIGVQPEQIFLQKFEIGLNIPTGSTSANDIINSALIFKNKEFKSFSTKYNHNDGRHVNFCDYEIKFYSKSSELVRYEISSNRMRYFSKFEITTLADFLDKDKLVSLFEFLISSFKKVVFFDRNSALLFAEETRWKYSSPNFWLGLDQYRRKVEFTNYLFSLEKAGITYIGEHFYRSMKDIGQSIFEESQEDSIFSPLGLLWKNENYLTHEFRFFHKCISFFASRGNGHAAATEMEYARPGKCEGQRRVRSPPQWSSAITGRVPVDFMVFLGLRKMVLFLDLGHRSPFR